MRRRLFLIGALVLPSVLVASAARAGDDLVLDLGGQSLELRHVDHGTFTMGATSANSTHDKDEEPAHSVTISHELWIGKYPVTREQFARFVGDTRYVTDAEKSGGSGWDGHQLVQKKDYSWKSPGFTQTDESPVVMVSFGDATAFVGWASRKTGKHVRLPTEAEWEYAARAGTTTPWYGGATEAENAGIGWFKAGAGGTRPVGQKRPNAFGIFDMSGDVFEWCRDVYRPYGEGPVTDPEVTTVSAGEVERRVLRGGSWARDIKRARSGARFRAAPGARSAEYGFRVVVTSDEGLGGGTSSPGADLAPVSPLGIGGAPVPAGSGGPATQASGPLADGEPVRLEPIPQQQAEPLSWTLLLASPIAAASAVVAWMLLRRKKGPRPVSLAPLGISTRLGEDGFFVRAPGAPRGARVKYTCLVDGVAVTDDAPVVGEETFIYTGAVPTAIRIVEIGPVRTLPPPSAHVQSAPPVPSSERPSSVRLPASRRAPVTAAPAPAESSRVLAPFIGDPTVQMATLPAYDDDGAGESVPAEVDQVTVPLVMPGIPPAPLTEPQPAPVVPAAPPSEPQSVPFVPPVHDADGDPPPASIPTMAPLSQHIRPIMKTLPPPTGMSLPPAPPPSLAAGVEEPPPASAVIAPLTVAEDASAEAPQEAPFLGHPGAY
ncbi:MAG: serine/threonine kinase [Labilithrix sp.]|nr:serine/threonine kinase [Labilithrix sp.]